MKIINISKMFPASGRSTVGSSVGYRFLQDPLSISLFGAGLISAVTGINGWANYFVSGRQNQRQVLAKSIAVGIVESCLLFYVHKDRVRLFDQQVAELLDIMHHRQKVGGIKMSAAVKHWCVRQYTLQQIKLYDERNGTDFTADFVDYCNSKPVLHFSRLPHFV